MAYDTITSFSYIQTFYADANIVGGATQISISSIDLYFSQKPDQQLNASGIESPGVSVSICNVTNDTPILTQVYSNSHSLKQYSDIYSFSDASTPTSFGFSTPVTLATNQFYGIVVTLDDPAYVLWTSKQGDELVGTNTPSSGSNLVKDGNLYHFNNSSTFNSLSDTDLTFSIRIAQFAANTVTDVYVNDNYEFLTLSSLNGSFMGGEGVYKLIANAAGTINISQGSNIVTGTGTNFLTLSAGQSVALYGNSIASQVKSVGQVTNATYMTLTSVVPFTNSIAVYSPTISGNVYYQDATNNKLFLTNSTASNTLYFTAGDTIVGSDSGASATIATVDNFSVDLFRLKGDASIPSSATMNTSVTFATYDGTNYSYNANNTISPTLNSNTSTYVSQYDTFILSRSNEVLNSSLYTQTSAQPGATSVYANKSASINVALSVAGSSNLYVSPTVDGAIFDIYACRYDTSANTFVLDANNIPYDSEVLFNGTAKSRHISTKLTFGNNQFAEDIRLYMNAYIPANTSVQVYARIHNSADTDAFDDKEWTPMVYVENANVFSSSVDRTNFIQYTLGLPQYPPSAVTLPGTFTSAGGSVVLQATANPSTYVATNDMIKLYNPLIPSDYIVGVVASVNSSSITLGSAVSNTNVEGYGFNVDRLLYKNVGFNNIVNSNVSRYYNSSLVEFDTFDSVQYKFVLLSNTSYVVPRVDYYQAIGVSA